jgi:hypothetical protein
VSAICHLESIRLLLMAITLLDNNLNDYKCILTYIYVLIFNRKSISSIME